MSISKRPDGKFTTRLPETWEECHEVLCEVEGAKADTRAFNAARAGRARRAKRERGTNNPQNQIEHPTGSTTRKTKKNKVKNKHYNRTEYH